MFLRLLPLILSVNLFAAEIDEFLNNAEKEYLENGNQSLLLSGPIEELFLSEKKPDFSCFSDINFILCNSAEGKSLNFDQIKQNLFVDGKVYTFFIEVNLDTGDQIINKAVWINDNLYQAMHGPGISTLSKLPRKDVLAVSTITEFNALLAKNMIYRIFENEYFEKGIFIQSGIDTIDIVEGDRFYIGGDKYSGKFNSYGELEGQGEYWYSNGDSFIGSFSENKKSGYGRYFFKNGDIYSGNYFRDEASGFVEILYANGDKYVGMVSNYELDGQGTYSFFEGSSYQGIWNQGKFSQGNHFDRTGKLIYSGSYKLQSTSFQRDGEGVLYIYSDDDDKNVSIYRGNFRDGLPNGEGEYIAGGAKYNGFWIDGEFTGRGFLQTPTVRYEGIFENFEILEGKIITDTWEYHGKWKDGNYHGKAKLVTKYDDGSIFEEFVEYEDGRIIGTFESDPTIFEKGVSQRIALVVGNSNYSDSFGYGNLKNPKNDALLIADKLRQAGFSVEMVSDVNNFDFLSAINKFSTKISSLGANVTALFYYSGHGIQVDGVNYLVPTNAEVRDKSDLTIENISANRVMNALEKNISGTNIVILDACRDNPFERAFDRSSNNGLSVMNAPKGTYIAYSTAPGMLAADGSGANSLFTASLAENLSKQGLSIEEVFKNTRREVAERTNNKQIPWTSSSLIGDFYFLPE
jgi:hypothetical protein